MTNGDRVSEKEEDIEAASGEEDVYDDDEIDPNDIVEVIDLDDNDNPPMDEEDEELEGGPRVTDGGTFFASSFWFFFFKTAKLMY